MRDSLPSDGVAYVRRQQQIAPARRQPLVWPRLLLLALILAGFLRLMWALDAKDLWWDESLSLQRAEADWPAVFLGHLLIRDGFSEMVTTDQHPFFFFVLLGLLIRVAGDSETVLRFPSVMSATLLIPLVWVWARRLAHSGVLPAGTPLWAALLAAAHPFFLWYGQEARPYALWALLALLSTYCLWRALHGGRGWWTGASISALMFYTTHYYALFLLPVHALMITTHLWAQRRRWAIALLALAGGGGGAVSLFAYWFIIIRQGGGGNFPSVDWLTLLRDLLNAFSMGPSADITRFWWLDVTVALVALLGTLILLRSRATLAAGGWLLPALVGVPVAALLVVGQFVPAYMNARHMSLIGGGFILLAATGLGVLSHRGRFARALATLLAAVVVGGMAASTHAYFTDEEYAKDDFSGLGAYLARRVAPGDLLLFQSPFAWRIFTYYTSLDQVQAAQQAGAPLAAYGVPLIGRDAATTEAHMAAWVGDYRRVWLIRSDTHPYMDPEGRTQTWLDDNLFQVTYYKYFSHSLLSHALYLEGPPVFPALPDDTPAPLDVAFGQEIGLKAIFLDPVNSLPVDGLALPVTLYWQALRPDLPRYKYILQLEETLPDGTPGQVWSLTEREPYEGAIPTIYWTPDQIIAEYSELPPPRQDGLWPRPTSASDAARYTITLQVYHAETLEKLPVRLIDAGEYHAAIQADGYTLRLPYWPAIEPGR